MSELIYGLNDRPSWPRGLVYGLQWVMIFLPSLTILSAIASDYLGLHGMERVLFIQRILMTTGLIMVLQTLWGHRYPLLDGPASALLLSFIILAPQGMSAIQGGMMVGGLFLLLLSAVGLLRYLAALFTDNVIGVILILVATTLMPYLAPMVIGVHGGRPVGDPLTFGVSILVMLAIAMFSHWLRGFPKTISLFLGVGLGTVFMGALGRLDTSGIGEAAWLSFPRPFFPGTPHFTISSTMTFMVAYVAVLINALGSIYSMGEVVGKEGMGSRVRRGIAATGLGGVIAGALGVIGTVSFAFSPGVVLVTRVGSRFAVTACGVFLICMAFLNKLLALMAAVPASVVGAAMITGMAAQIGVGISVLTRASKRMEGRDHLVIGIPLLMGGIVSILPGVFFETFFATAQALMKNGLVVGIILVLLLEHGLLPKRGGH